MPPVNDLAGGSAINGLTPEQLFAGEIVPHTDAGVSTTAISKYEVVKRSATNTLARTADTSTDSGKDYVIAAQPASGTGVNVPYYDHGHFNADILVWPANLDTFAKRKNFFAGTNISVSQLR